MASNLAAERGAASGGSMRDLVFVALTTCMACARLEQPAPQPVSGAQGPAALDTAVRSEPVRQQRDSLLPRLRSARMLAGPDSLTCPMPIVVPDSGATVPMPVVPLGRASRMPVVRPGCVNPLFQRRPERR